jgi:hypothetical protein
LSKPSLRPSAVLSSQLSSDVHFPLQFYAIREPLIVAEQRAFVSSKLKAICCPDEPIAATMTTIAMLEGAEQQGFVLSKIEALCCLDKPVDLPRSGYDNNAMLVEAEQ